MENESRVGGSTQTESQPHARRLFWATSRCVCFPISPKQVLRFGFRYLQLFAACLLVSSPLAALNPAQKPGSYSIHGWFTEQGLPSNKIRAVFQTRDSYLWVATAQGLARFDGSRFTAFTGTTQPELRGGGFYGLQETPDGTLWCGGDNGLFRWVDGHFERFTTQQGLADNYVRALALTRDGGLVICTRAGYSFMREGRITSPGGIWKEITGVARSYLEQADGTLLLGTEDGLWRIKGDKLERLSGTPEFPGGGYNGLAEAPDGTVWIGSSMGLRAVHADGKMDTYGPAEGLTNPRVANLRFDHDGNLWIGSYAGLYRFSHGLIQSASYPGQIGDSPIQQMREDKEGGWWIAASTGLFYLKDNVGGNIGPAEGLAQTSVYSVFEASDGAWWIGLWGGGVYRYDQTRATPLPVPSSLGLDLVICFIEEPAGTFWIGCNSGLYRYTGDTTVNLYDNARASAWLKQLAEKPDSFLPGIAHRHVNSIAPDAEGGLWVATDGALYHGREGKFRAYTTADGLPTNTFKSVLRARNGDIWVTAPPLGVSCLHEGRWINYLCGKRISDIYPRAVYQDSGGDIWITTDGGGLNQFKDGHWRVFTVHDGLTDDFIAAMVEDGLGNFWIPCPRGIMRIPRVQFDEINTGQRTLLEPHVFDRSDGLPPGEVNQIGWPAASRTRDGRLLFATNCGVAVIEPQRLKTNQLAPPVRIERVLVNDKISDLSRPMVLPPGDHDVQIQYTALSLLVPENVRFKTRLTPLDHQWVDAGGRREVRYDRLPAGNYRFQVIGSNNDGIWNEQGASFAFSVQPPFYQTAWFIGLSILSVVTAAFTLYRIRLHRARRRLAELETLVQVRTRELQDAHAHLEKRVEERTAALKQAQHQTQLERARFKFIFDSVPVGISWFMPDEAVTYIFNPAHERITGIYGAGAFVPGAFARVSHPDDFARQQELSEKFLRHEIAEYSLEKRYLHPDGKIVWARFTSRMFVDPATGKQQTVTTLVDLTELKLSQEEMLRERSRFKFIFESLPVGVSWMLNTQVGTRIVNAEHARLTGVPIEQSHQLDLYRQATHPNDRDRQLELHQRLVSGEIDHYTIEKRYVHPDASLCWVSLTVRFFRDPASGATQELSALVDITERKQAEVEREELNRQLLESSRQAGMAEVATGVLHNVSNVLNSVNIATSCVADSLKKSKSANLSKVVALMREHESNLGEYITSDPKGKQLPVYLAQLAELLAKDQASALKELGELQKNVEHIKDIVTQQQSFAKIAATLEPIAPTDIVEDALKMNASSLGRHDVQVIRDFAEVPLITTEKNKVLQILINLVRNATQACDETVHEKKHLTVRVASTGAFVRIAVIDNGVGIAPENLGKMFSHGFTTKKDGHGFGLHSAALTAKQLGGSLTVQSEGLGKGATFVLELPFQPPPRSVSL